MSPKTLTSYDMCTVCATSKIVAINFVNATLLTKLQLLFLVKQSCLSCGLNLLPACLVCQILTMKNELRLAHRDKETLQVWTSTCIHICFVFD